MRNLFVTVVAALLTICLVLPVQAGQITAGVQDVTVTSPCINCGQAVNTGTLLPQGETEEIQPLEDHTWGGDPDDHVYGSMWDLIMCLAYWDESCNVYYHQTIWLD